MITKINEFKQILNSETPFSLDKNSTKQITEAVYREGYAAIKDIENATKQVFNDAADAGAPTKKGDNIWNWVKQLFDWYGDEDSRKQDTPDTYSFTFTLMDEWAVSDKRKTEKEATDQYRLTYTKLDSYKKKPYLNAEFKDADGFVTVEKIN